jgi:hypothetical protein
MGLDMTVLGKPLPGHETEFDILLRALAVAKGVMQDSALPLGLFRRLTGRALPRMGEVEIAEKTDRFNAISVPPYAVLDAPLVGKDAAADAWVLEQAAKAGKTADEGKAALAEMAGYHVLALVPPCDGLPVYSHGDMGYHVDLTSFRGALLDNCTAVVSAGDRRAAWEVMTAPKLLAYGQSLSRQARDYAVRTGLAAMLGRRTLDWDDPAAPEAQLHITDSLARWATFWGGRGHGSYPDF